MPETQSFEQETLVLIVLEAGNLRQAISTAGFWWLPSVQIEWINEERKSPIQLLPKGLTSQYHIWGLASTREFWGVPNDTERLVSSVGANQRRDGNVRTS